MYNKLFTSILDSSIWLEPMPTRIVWITLLAAMDEDGYAHFSAIENLANRARVTVAECNAAVTVLQNTDPNSADPANGGRRLERVPGGFMVLNAAKYRDLGSREKSKEMTRLRVKRHRESQISGPDVTVCNDSVTPSEAEAYTETETEAETKNTPSPQTLLLAIDENSTSTTNQAVEILEHLNEKAERQFQQTIKTIRLIRNRLKDVKGDMEGIKKMIDRQCAKWKGDAKMDEYLRPTTLFNGKFDDYYGARNAAYKSAKPAPEPIDYSNF